MSFQMNLSANTLRSNIIEPQSVCAVALSCWTSALLISSSFSYPKLFMVYMGFCGGASSDFWDTLSSHDLEDFALCNDASDPLIVFLCFMLFNRGVDKVDNCMFHPLGPHSGTECRCCQSSLLDYWAQSWTGRHSDAGYSNGSIIPASWYLFCRPQKDDRLSQPHLVSTQWPGGFELRT